MKIIKSFFSISIAFAPCMAVAMDYRLETIKNNITYYKNQEQQFVQMRQTYRHQIQKVQQQKKLLEQIEREAIQNEKRVEQELSEIGKRLVQLEQHLAHYKKPKAVHCGQAQRRVAQPLAKPRRDQPQVQKAAHHAHQAAGFAQKLPVAYAAAIQTQRQLPPQCRVPAARHPEEVHAYARTIKSMHGVKVVIPAMDYSRDKFIKAQLIDEKFFSKNAQYGAETALRMIRQSQESNFKKVNVLTGILDFLGECNCQRFDRIKTPLRNNLERNIPIKQFAGKDVTYTFIGAGELFSAVWKISQLVQIHPRSIRLNLIDRSGDYTIFIALSKRYGTRLTEVLSALYYKDDQAVKAFLKQAGVLEAIQAQLKSEGQAITDRVVAQTFKEAVLFIRQVVRWFAYMQSQHKVTIELVVYENFNDYKVDIDNRLNGQSDLLVIEDLSLNEPELKNVIIPAVRTLLKDGGIYAILMDHKLPFFSNLSAPIWADHYFKIVPGGKGSTIETDGLSVTRAYVGPKNLDLRKMLR